MGYLSKEAKKLAKMKFSEEEPKKIVYQPKTIERVDSFFSIDNREELLSIANNPDFESICADSDGGYLSVYYSHKETQEECNIRVAKQENEWRQYEERKSRFYADIQKRILEAETAENNRRENFKNPEYLEFLRLKKKFGNEA